MPEIAIRPSTGRMLVAIKLLHTAIWLFFAGCIVVIPFAAALDRFSLADVLSALVLAECIVIGLNQGHCPLTDFAARSTGERVDNFDIYLPLWLARHNKAIFGTLFAMGEVFTLVRWFLSSH
ncbi:MAG TPA: hypothetical protein VGB94_04020 [Acidobacteriaceae bacterium]